MLVGQMTRPDLAAVMLLTNARWVLPKYYHPWKTHEGWMELWQSPRREYRDTKYDLPTCHMPLPPKTRHTFASPPFWGCAVRGHISTWPNLRLIYLTFTNKMTQRWNVEFLALECKVPPLLPIIWPPPPSICLTRLIFSQFCHICAGRAIGSVFVSKRALTSIWWSRSRFGLWTRRGHQTRGQPTGCDPFFGPKNYHTYETFRIPTTMNPAVLILPIFGCSCEDLQKFSYWNLSFTSPSRVTPAVVRHVAYTALQCILWRVVEAQYRLVLNQVADTRAQVSMRTQ